MSIKYALILSAGRGERLKPLTDQLPKPLIKVGNYRLIEYHLNKLMQTGVKIVYINRAYLYNKFNELIDESKYEKLDIRYIDENEGALETAGAIINVLQKNCQIKKLLVINADIWSDFDYATILKMPSQSLAQVVLVKNPEHNLKGDFSINQDQLIEKNHQSYTFAGIGVYHRKIFENESIGKKKLAPILYNLIQSKQISALVHNGNWIDVGTYERLEEIKQRLNVKSSDTTI